MSTNTLRNALTLILILVAATACAKLESSYKVSERVGTYTATITGLEADAYIDEMWEADCLSLRDSDTDCEINYGSCYEADTGETYWVADSSLDYSEYLGWDYFDADYYGDGSVLMSDVDEYSYEQFEWEEVLANCDSEPDADGDIVCEVYIDYYGYALEYETDTWCSVDVTEWYALDSIHNAGSGENVVWPSESELAYGEDYYDGFDYNFSGVISFYANGKQYSIQQNYSSEGAYENDMTQNRWIGLYSNDEYRLLTEDPTAE